MSKKLKNLLDSLAGEKEIEWIIPHPFLPPRYKKICENRNMVLLLSRNLTVRIRWEGARLGEWISPSPVEIRRLIREVKRKMTDYRKQLDIYSNFITEWVDTTSSNPVEDDPSSHRKPREAVILDDCSEEVVAEIKNIKTTKTDTGNMGGESPLPLFMEFFS